MIGSADGEEYVLIEEEGPYHGFVFCNLHDEGLSTAEELMEGDDVDAGVLSAVYSDEPYEEVSTKTPIEWMPFFQNPVARSLEEFFDQLVSASA